MTSIIYENINKINEDKKLSLKYMCLLNKISYKTLKSKINRNSNIDEETSYKLVLSYNLTLKQLLELKSGKDYHKMVDNKYYWNIIYGVQNDLISKQTGLKQISAIFLNADGTYSYFDGDIVFNPEYELKDYIKYTTSLILVNKYKKVRNNNLDPVLASIEEEKAIISNCLSKVNQSFNKDILKDIFYYKYVLGFETNNIIDTLNISKNRYYRLLNDTNSIAYKTFGLYKEVELKRMIECVSNI